MSLLHIAAIITVHHHCCHTLPLPLQPRRRKSNDLMAIPMPIRKTINALKWERFCDARSPPDDELVRLFYASLTIQDATEVIVLKKKSSTISKERMLLLYAILTEKSINVGKIILKKIYDCAKKKTRSAYFPSLITSLCLRAHVKTQANLKGQYVQGCITSHDLERLVEKVHELNQSEQEEPTEPDTEESTNETETESVIATEEEEEESDKEPNSPKPVEESKNPEPRV
ncbi:hypothetical protein PVK06_001566 [Gossypium arboreum]|uniref:Putative plant transposon protein domain-containing protein n=1 Tax=Gossypium arboreum TaxID=29729 RepID=A0ABR0R2C7_GOSAR|nr:hypothetical protein PVK06_001566 [Gossypium arboreum]